MSRFSALHRWTVQWSERPHASWVLFLLAFAEASFFPVPPDLLLLLLCLSLPERSFRYALICTSGSVLGGAFGFFIGLKFWSIAEGILYRYIEPATFQQVREYFLQYQGWAVAVAGFTPIPYKVFTIAAGFFRVNFWIFLTASLLSRGARFFAEAAILYFFGQRAKVFIERYFNLVTIAVVLILLIGYLLLRWLR